MAYHSHDGWYFERDKEGRVVLQKRLPIRNVFAGDIDGWPVEHVVFTPEEWASIVASVSARGENADTFNEAVGLHG